MNASFKEKKEKIGIVGAGVMGGGVAQRFSTYGYEVVLLDIEQDILKVANREISRNLKAQSMFNKNVNLDEIMNRITFSLDYNQLADVDVIIENVPEIVEVKEKVYKELAQICKDECIYMVNTSCIPITSIARFVKYPERVIGVHFMNPVPMKNFAEVIKGVSTLEEIISLTQDLLQSVDIIIEVVNDSAGFVSNRISHLYMNEAAFLVYEGVATAKQIDNIFKKAFNHKMGPLETADLIGVDTVLDSLHILYDQYEDPKYRACPLLKRMVESGKTGRKSGEGFYKY